MSVAVAAVGVKAMINIFPIILGCLIGIHIPLPPGYKDHPKVTQFKKGYLTIWEKIYSHIRKWQPRREPVVQITIRVPEWWVRLTKGNDQR